MAEPAYLVDLENDDVTIWIRRAESVREAVVPIDGSIMLRDAETDEIVGKRVSRWREWSDDALGRSFATAFGWGQAGPLIALRRAAGLQLGDTR